MKNEHEPPNTPETGPRRRGPHGGRHGHRHPQDGLHGRRSGRPFDHGELRLLVLALIAEQPRHGYELIKEIEGHFGGSYSPSPGVIYPTLAWMDDMGFVSIDTATTGRKSYSLTEEGRAFLDQNREAIDAIRQRIDRKGRRDGIPAPMIRAMENLKLALRLRLSAGEIDEDTVARIAAVLDAAAQEVERTR